MTRTIRSLLPALLLILAAAAPAATLVVPDQHATLAEALAAAEAGDVIELAPGVHDVRGVAVERSVTLRGLGLDADQVVLDGGTSRRILSIEQVSGPVWIQNLTFRDGFALGESTNLMSGGALFVSYSNVVLQNCRFVGNRAAAHGGAVRSIESRLRLSQCDFENNVAQLGGGAVDASYDADPEFVRCRFRGNTATWGGAVSARGGASPTFTGCEFLENAAGRILGYGGAVYADYAGAPAFDGCTFRGNTARLGGALACFQGSLVSVSRSTLVANAGSEAGGGFFCLDGSPQIAGTIIAFQEGTGITSEAAALPEVACTGVWSNSGGDVEGPLGGTGSAELIRSDPLFCVGGDVEDGRFPLSPASPLAPGAVACGTAVGAWPVGCTRELPQVTGLDAQQTPGYVTVAWNGDGDPLHDRYRLVWVADGQEHEILFAHQGDGRYTAFAELPPEIGNSYSIDLYARNADGLWESLLDGEVGNGDDDTPPPAAPTGLEVRNWPNPFNPATTIACDIPRDQHVRVSIFGMDGRRVAVLHDGPARQGTLQLPWQGRDERGRQLASGTYLVRVEGDRHVATHKISLLK